MSSCIEHAVKTIRELARRDCEAPNLIEATELLREIVGAVRLVPTQTT